MKKIFICIITIIFCTATTSWATAYNLDQAIRRALEANPGLEAKLLAVERAKLEIGVAQSHFWPKASLVSNTNRLSNSGNVGTTDELSNRSWGQGVRANMSLFSGFSHLNSVQKSLISVEVEKARHQQAKLQLIGNIQLQYLELLRAREDMKTVINSKQRIAMQLKAAKAFVEVGMAPYVNILQNEVEMSKVQQQEIRTLNAIRNAEVKLNQYLNYDEKTQIQYTGRLQDIWGTINYTEEQAINTAMFSRPDLIIAQKSITIAVKDSHITAGKYLPSVNVTYDNMVYSKDFDDKAFKDYSRSYWSVGLNITWEIFDGGGTTFAYLSDRKKISSMRKEYEETMSAARAEVIRALLDIHAAKELITASRKGVASATESYKMADKRYQTHTGTITELLDAQLKLTQAEGDYNQSLTEYHSARAKFFYYIGRENCSLQ